MATQVCSTIISGYQISEVLYAGSRTRVYRAIRQFDQLPVVIKLLTSESPSFQELLQFRNQYNISKNLRIPGIVHSLALEPYGSGYILVMADTGGIALREYIKATTLSLSEFLVIAIQLANILQNLHQNRVIHKDIKPANILINPQTKQVQLIDFSIASLLPKETQEIKSPNVLEGTLAYVSPEQTGRMNRGIDYRSDFYSLGVTFYELLTGNLPFICDDPMELVHCHIAKQPDELNGAEIPQVIAEIVMKLMAKNAEDRYQSALSLKFDLETCLAQYQLTGKIEYFTIAERDICDRFLFPEKLYGREAEVQTLINAVERVSAGSSELMLVAGFSGIGKTAVVNEMYKLIAQQRGYFIQGKFDQFDRNIPFFAFVQAFRNLMAQLLSESDTQLQQWQAKILAVVRENGQVLIEVIPELELIIGKQPPAPELSGSAAQNRFNLLFQKFIEIFTTINHPLVIFLDDLQWADLASLELIKVLMHKSSYLLLLGAYRDNEVSPVHPLMLMVEQMKPTQASVNTINLQPLTFEDTNHLVADTLNCSLEIAKPLTELIERKTQGNPFFTIQFLKALHEEKYITFNCDRCYWECDLIQVNALSLTDDVVEFMALQLQKLPASTQNVLKLAACVGNTFDLATVMLISEQSPMDTATALWKALQEGLILPNSQVYQFFHEDMEDFETEHTINPTYRFLHDRVQQAAYSLIDYDQKQITHYQIGQKLLHHTPVAQQENKIFDIVNHLHLGVHFITQQLEKDELAKLNLTAGRKAKKSNAYKAAIKYFIAGINLLSADSWENNYKLTFFLYQERAECEYLLGNFAQAEKLFDITLQHAKSVFDQADIYAALINLKITQGEDFNAAIDAGFRGLDILGITLPNTPAEIQIALDAELQKLQAFRANKIYYDLLSLPAMSNPIKQACMKLLAVLLAASYLAGNIEITQLICLLMTHTSLEYGNSETSGLGYCYYGMALVKQGEYKVAYQFAQQALELDQKFNNIQYLAQNSNIFCHTINPYIKPLKTNLSLYQRSFKICSECGDLVFGVGSVIFLIWTMLMQGECLGEIYAETEKYANYIQQVNDVNILHIFTQQRQFLLHLQGLISETELLADWEIEDINCINTWRKNNFPSGINWYCFLRIQLSYIYGDYTDAVKTAIMNEETLAANLNFFPIIQYHFYYPLSLIALYPTATLEEKQSYWQIIQQHQQLIKTWADNCPENFLHKYYLLTAEMARVSGNFSQAIELYDRAIAGAQKNEYLQEAALSNELAAKFYLNWGKEKIASVYMQEAYYGYTNWGATAKTEDLEYRYPHLLRSVFPQANPVLNIWDALETLVLPNISSSHSSTTVNSSSSANINTAIDFTTILKASQVLSSTIQLDELLQKLTQIILQNSGGDYCALILPDSEGHWQLQAIATPETIQLFSEPFEGNFQLPIKLIQYVKNTQEVIVFDNLKTNLPVIGEYLTQHQPKSVLCLPILNQGNLVGILYLRNQFTSGVFTSDRILILNFLCTQAAISLENARLHAQEREKSYHLEQSQKRLQIMIQQTPVAILEWNTKFEFQSWNPAAEKLFGYQAAEIIGKHLRTIIPEEYHAYVDDVATSILAETGGSHAINENITKDGQRIVCEWFNAPMLDLDGNVCGGVSMGLDISDRQRAEAAIHKKSQELETALQDLKQAQLQMVQNEKMASLGNLVAGVAHEVNNPIGFLNGSITNAKEYIRDLIGHLKLYQQYYSEPAAPIQQNAEEIDLEFLVADLPKLLHSMTEANKRIKSISNSLRTFSRADTDCKVIANIHEGLDSTLLILKYRLKANENRPAINIQQEYGDIPEIECFPGQLNQVFMNILANAIDMFDEMAQTQTFAELQTHPQVIIIRTYVTANQVYIHIRDNGKGMSADVKSRIFDHLFTTKSVGQGTGLGLAIARQIVEEKHGGQIAVNSIQGKGTEFIIQIPV
ncbi:MAG: AAA family ATPase [Nostoc sp. TH1S01]|nr:AAA family ATPase [Nostoc sp. TH1S01]